MTRLFRAIFARRKPTPEPVDDFRDVLDDLWADREARRDAELRRRIQFEMECG